jgi:replicative DNA helicase Mcm
MEPTIIIDKFQELCNSKFRNELMQVVKDGLNYFKVSFKEISLHDIELADAIIDNPEESIRALELAIKKIDLGIQDDNFRVRIVELPKTQKVPIRNIRVKHIDKFISVEGIIRSRTNVRPRANTIRFECPACGNIITVIQMESEQKEPTSCGCGRKGKFRIISKEYYDAMGLILEEDVSELGEDTMPKRINVLMKYDLTSPESEELSVPGSNLRINGILKEIQVSTKRGKSNQYELLIEVNSIEPLDDSVMKPIFTDSEVREFDIFCKRKDMMNELVSSVAPHIEGYEEIKRAVLFFIVKSTPKYSEKNKVSVRDFFHILVIGDPGTGKSVFGKEVVNLSWKSKTAVGKGASGVGLTASSERDEFLGQRVLQAGTIPMCNGGHVFIDEVDKMDDEVLSHLLSAMEDGEINISKSQVQGKLKANVGVFMVANPKQGRFDPYSMVSEQINLPSPLISRYDFIFPIRDIKNKKENEQMIDKILNKHLDIEATTERKVPLEFMRRYLFYASQKIKPKLTEDAVKIIKNFAMKMRCASGQDQNAKSVKITARQIESPIRIAEAAAKLRLSDKVSADDAKLAIELLLFSLKGVGIDPETGELDIDRIVSSVSSSTRNRVVEIKRIIDKLSNSVGNLIPINDLIEEAESKGINEEKAEDALERLKKTGDVIEPKRGFIQKI